MVKQNHETNKEQIPRIATILFVDLIGSSDVASIQDSKEYNKYVKQFQNMTLKVFEEETEVKKDAKRTGSLTEDFIDFNVRGDEGFLVLAGLKNHKRDLQHTIEKDIITSLRIALRLKYEWLFERNNLSRMRKMKRPFEIAIGINTGRIDLLPDPNFKINSEKKYAAQGYAINLAKRIEGQSRKGTSSGVIVSEYTFGKYTEITGANTLRFIPQEKSSLKGISGKVQLYELVYANLDDEDELMKIPKKWFNKRKKGQIQKVTRAGLKKVEEEFNDTLIPWFGQVVSNFKWRKAWHILESNPTKSDKKEARKLLKESSIIARKLIEIRPKESFWKIYLAEIIYDLIQEEFYNGYREKKLLIKESMGMLENIVSSDPIDLDAPVYYGMYFLDILETAHIIDKDDKVELNTWSVKQKEAIIEQYERVLLWDEKYATANYYLAAALLKPAVDEDGKIEFPHSREKTKSVNHLIKGIKDSAKIDIKYKDRMINDVKKDSNFDAVRHLAKYKKAVM